MSQHAPSSHEHAKNPTPCAGHAGCSPKVAATPTPAQPGVAVYRISTMDCAAEEGEIRHALKDLPGLRSLNFQLTARTIAIDAPPESL
nr:cation transporter [Rhodoferax sp.]